jgi:hypothetical protein
MDDSELRKRLRYALLVDFLEIDGINICDLTCDMADPSNAIYRVPLPEPNEQKAREMADISFNAVLDQHLEDPNFDSDVAYEQSLTDARRLLLDPNFDLLLNLSTDLHLIDHGPVKIIQAMAADCFPRLTTEQRASFFQHK